MITKTQTQATLRNIAANIAAHARTAHAERTAIKADPMVPPAGLGGVLRQHTDRTNTARRALTDKARDSINSYRLDNVKRPPSFRPGSAAEASWLAAIAVQAVHYSPAVLAETIESAIADGDTAMVALLLPLASSLTSYAKPFTASTAVIAATVKGRQFLDSTPEIVASKAAADYADALSFELGALENALTSDTPIDLLDKMVEFHALPNLLPVSV